MGEAWRGASINHLRGQSREGRVDGWKERVEFSSFCVNKTNPAVKSDISAIKAIVFVFVFLIALPIYAMLCGFFLYMHMCVCVRLFWGNRDEMCVSVCVCVLRGWLADCH